MAQSIHDAATLRSSVNDYYQYNPDTLMPLLMLALASQGRLHVGGTEKKGSTRFASIDIDEVKAYEWVKLNPALKKRLKAAQESGAKEIIASGEVPAELKDIYDIFYKYDTETVVQEFHHRIGILTDHSSNALSEKAQRQYATIMLAEEFCAIPNGNLQSRFLLVANRILVKSGLQPERERLKVAETLCSLLSYDGRGVVYNPFAGCAIAGAMIGAGSNLYADGDGHYDKLTAVARLLCYGTGQRGYNIEQRDSTKWLDCANPEYVLSTFLGYPEGKSAFDFCLGKCLENFKESGKYAGMVSPRDLFENQSLEMKKALQRDWIDTIVLLPFGEAAVLVNANKPRENKNHVKFLNMTHPWLSEMTVSELLKDEFACVFIKNTNVLNKKFMQSLVLPAKEDKVGYKLVRLGDYVKKIRRHTYNLENVSRDKRVLISIDRTIPYSSDAFRRKRITSLFAPSYKLNADCLITNSAGVLEPRIFEHDYCDVFFQDGYAFEITRDFETQKDRNKWLRWIIDELNEEYVLRQLHPYGMSEMVPEHISEDAILNLWLYERLDEDEEARIKSLPEGTRLTEGNNEYTILKFLGHGSFGYTYKSLLHNKTNDDERQVVLKEFFPWEDSERDGIIANIDDFEHDEDKASFLEEASIMEKLGNTPDSHIAPAFGLFYSNETETSYYMMPFYSKKSFEDLCKSGYHLSEGVIIRDVIIPLCKALRLAHKSKVLHLDIKPENIMLGDDGKAILIDFGVAKKYDKDNKLINRWGKMSCSEFAAPEMRIWKDKFMAIGRTDKMVNFDPKADIYGLAASVYYIATSLIPTPITYNSAEDIPILKSLSDINYSEQFARAIAKGLQFSAPARPRNAQAFLNLFPGCEDIKL